MFLAIALVMIVLSAVLMRRRRVVGVGGVRGRLLLVLGLGGWRRGWLLRAKLGYFDEWTFFFCVVVLVCGFLGCG